MIHRSTRKKRFMVIKAFLKIADAFVSLVTIGLCYSDFEYKFIMNSVR